MAALLIYDMVHLDPEVIVLSGRSCGQTAFCLVLPYIQQTEQGNLQRQGIDSSLQGRGVTASRLLAGDDGHARSIMPQLHRNGDC